MERKMSLVVFVEIFILAVFLMSSSGVNLGFAAGEAAYKEALKTWPQIEAAAKKEGKVVVYGFAHPVLDKVKKELFEKKYPGIKVEKVGMRGTESRARIETEVAAKKGLGDVVYQGVNGSIYFSENGLTLPFQPPNGLEPGVPWVMSPLQYGNDHFTQYGAFHGLGVNKKLVPRAKYPKSYRDLADPYWKGKFTIKDPRRPDSGVYWWYTFEKLYGKGFLKKLMENEPKVMRGQNQQHAALSSGQVSLLLSLGASFSAQQIAKGAPIDWYIPEEGPLTILIQCLISKTAPHPNAAKLFVNFILSKEYNAARGAHHSPPYRTDVPADPIFAQIKKVLPPFTQDEYKNVLKQKAKEATVFLKDYGL